MAASPDPAALSVELAAVPPSGVPVAVRADAERLGLSGGGGAGGRGDEFELLGPVSLDGRIERLSGEGFRLRGRLGGSARLDCVRCLDPVEIPLAEALDLVYLPGAPAASGRDSGGGREPGGAPANGGPAAPAGGETALDAEDLNVSFYAGDRLELAETLREQVHLALPVKPLCSPSCRGLCASCGANRNSEAECRCAAAPPPGGSTGLAALRDLPGFDGLDGLDGPGGPGGRAAAR